MAFMPSNQPHMVPGWYGDWNGEFDLDSLNQICDRETRDYLIALHHSGFLFPSPSTETSDEEVGNSTTVTCPAFSKLLFLKPDVQELAHSIAGRVQLEMEAGQEEDLASPRWLASASNWAKVNVTPTCLGLISQLRDKLATMDMFRVGQPTQTAAFRGPDETRLSATATVVQFHHGVTRVQDFLATEDHNAVLVSLVVPEMADVFASHKNFPDDPVSLRLCDEAGYLVSGRTQLRVVSPRPILCIVFSTDPTAKAP